MTTDSFTHHYDHHLEQPRIRILRPKPALQQQQDGVNAEGVSVTKDEARLSSYAAGALSLFLCFVVLLTAMVCLLRLRQWRIRRWKRKHVVVLPESEQHHTDDEDELDGIFTTLLARRVSADHEYIQRTMAMASGFVRQCLNAQAKTTPTTTTTSSCPLVLPDAAGIALSSSCASLSSSASTRMDDEDTTAAATTVTTVLYDDEECPSTISVTIQPSTTHDDWPQAQEEQVDVKLSRHRTSGLAQI